MMAEMRSRGVVALPISVRTCLPYSVRRWRIADTISASLLPKCGARGLATHRPERDVPDGDIQGSPRMDGRYRRFNQRPPPDRFHPDFGHVLPLCCVTAAIMGVHRPEINLS